MLELCLDSVAAVPRCMKKAKKARNAKKAARKLLREEGLGRRVPRGSAESEADPYNQVVPRKLSCQDRACATFSFSSGNLPLQSDWSLSCDQGLDRASLCENNNSCRSSRQLSIPPYQISAY